MRLKWGLAAGSDRGQRGGGKVGMNKLCRRGTRKLKMEETEAVG